MKTPVLFLIFNRPDTTKAVFASIREARPERLYVAADGPRAAKSGEGALCQEAREIVSQIDWPCRLSTLFREENLGCRNAVSSAISWFFEQEEEGIILEDDCLPDPSFYGFCANLLEHYRHDTRIGHIGGNNFQDGAKRGEGSYYFSRYNHIWGWASWRRAWKHYDFEMVSYPAFRKTDQLGNIFSTSKERSYWYKAMDKAHAKGVNTWDYQWTYSLWAQGALSVLPNVNLVTNIGFGENATHTSSDAGGLSNIPLSAMNDISHPPFILADTAADLYTFNSKYAVTGHFIKDLLRKL